MALNQVIHGSNRVVENPNRYKLNPVSGQANTYDLEKQPGVITDNGTPYNKIILDTIDNVLSYLTPSVEKVPIETPTITNVLYGIGTSGSRDNEYNVDGTILQDGSVTKTHYKIHTIQYEDAYSDWDSNRINLYFSTNSYSSLVYANLTINQFIEFNLLKPRKATIHYRINNASRAIIQGSNDGTTYDILGTITTGDSTYVSNTPYKYYRILATETSVNVYYFYLSDIEDTKIEYQNQFTLDNNTSFTNNQRVLIETDKNVEETEITYPSNVLATTIDNERIDTYNEKLFGKITPYDTYDTDIIPTYEYHTTARDGFISTSNLTPNSARVIPKESGSGTYSKIDFLNNEKRTSWDSSNFNYFDMNRNENVFIDKTYDFKQPVKIKINYRITLYNLSSAIIEASNDNINWDLIDNISNDIDTIKTINTYYRYYRLKFTNDSTNSNGGINLYYVYISEIKYIKEIETPYQGVSSNTLNGIDIPTLLQPSTKYELNYNEDTNKFDLDGLMNRKTLYDIKLTEAVNQVDLNGIISMLDETKIYGIIINGTTSSTDSIYFSTINIATSNVNVDSYITGPILFKYYVGGNGKHYISVMSANSNTGNVNTILDGREYIKCNTSSTKFNAGTRIIIKEVA